MLPTATTRWLSLPSYVRASFAVDSRFDAVMCGACLLATCWQLAGLRASEWDQLSRGEGGCSHPPAQQSGEGRYCTCVCASGQGKIRARRAVQSGWLFQKGGCQC